MGDYIILAIMFTLETKNKLHIFNHDCTKFGTNDTQI